MSEQKTVKTFKALKKGLKCRNFQYEIGKEHEHIGKVDPCNSGFHGCEDPLDVLNYYDLMDSDGEMAEFAEVEQSGEVKIEGDKTCSSKIKILAKIDLGALLKASVDIMFEKIGFKELVKKTKKEEENVNASSGNETQNASSGDWTRNASSGDRTRNASSGYGTRNIANGKNCIIMACHHNSKVKGSKGTLVALSHFEKDKDDKWIPKKIVTGEIGKKGLKIDTWYGLDEKGKFTEVGEND